MNEVTRETTGAGREVEVADQAVVVTNVSGQVLLWDPAAEVMFGRTRAEVLGRPLVETLAAPESVTAFTGIVRALRRGDGRSQRLVARDATDARIAVAVHATPAVDVDGTVLSWTWTFLDVAHRSRQRQAARNFSALLEGLGDAVIAIDTRGTVTSWSNAAEQIYGYAAEEIIGQSISAVVPADEHDQFLALLARVSAGETVRGIEAVRVRCDGSRVDVRLTGLPAFDADGRIVGATIVVRDVTEARQATRALRWQAQHDPLTRLPNHAALVERLDAALLAAAAGELPPAVLLLDLDGFRDINSAHGREAGDRVLSVVADRLQRALPTGSLVARNCGDEFAVVLDGATADEARSMGARLQDVLRAPIPLGTARVVLTVTIGIAATNATDGEELLRLAGTAVATAQRGRGQIRVYEPGAAQQARLRMELAHDLAIALAENQLRLHYQPIVDLKTHRLRGVEALARWDHPIRGPIPPEQFIAAAESASLVVELDRWVLRRACADAALLRDRGVLPRDGGVAVNLCLETLVSGEADTLVAAALREAGLAPAMLVLEVQEVGLAQAPAAGPVLDRLRRLGVGLAVDAFGAGGSTLSDLRRFAVGALKIDRGFIARMGEDATGASVVASVLEVARGLGVTAIAMGVETPAQAAALARLGCPAAQGFLYGGPVPLSQLNGEATVFAADHPAESAAPSAASRRKKAAADITADHGLLRALQLQTAGASPTSIAAALNREGFRTPQGQRWHARVVEQALSTSHGLTEAVL